MKKYLTMKNVVIGLVVLVVALVATRANAADVSGYAGLKSDYIFRGINQSNGPSAFLGLDLNFESGAYVGAWAGQVDFGDDGATEEVDLYAGYSNSVGGVDYDISYIDYGYRGDSSLDYEEVVVSLTFLDAFTLTHVAGLDDALDYNEISSDVFRVADISYGIAQDAGSNVMISKGFDLLGGTLSIGYVEFKADDDSGFVDEENFFAEYSRPIF
tara:strand:- start:9272 stop:9913 length:642 start_codon:yes stop_codon:yes gene_type:complete